MRLENDYYLLTRMDSDGMNGTFRIAVLPGCPVYRGHFPGHPVCPGVFNIQTIKECAERLAGRPLHIRHIRRCRLTAVATPAACPELELRIRMQPLPAGYAISATLADEQRTYMDYKGEMSL